MKHLKQITFICIIAIFVINCAPKKSDTQMLNETTLEQETVSENIAEKKKDFIETVSIPAGTLTWEDAVITLTAFKIGKYEVTQEQYQEIMGINPSYFDNSGQKEFDPWSTIDTAPTAGEEQGKRPVENVTWFDAVEFCNKLSIKEGLTPVYTIIRRTPKTGYPITAATVTATWTNNGYRLPTEAQWEYACRAGATTKYLFGDTESGVENYAWCNENANFGTHEAGKKLPNAFGLYDMIGNVWEWCWDLYGDYPATAKTDYKGAVSGDTRVMRGASWVQDAFYHSFYYRVQSTPDHWSRNLGFRVVLPEETAAEGKALAQETAHPIQIGLASQRNLTLWTIHNYEDEGNLRNDIVITSETALKYFSFIAVNYDYEDSTFKVEKILYTIPELKSSQQMEAFRVNTNLGEGLMPTRGISYLHGDALKHFYIGESGFDGSLTLTEFNPYYTRDMQSD